MEVKEEQNILTTSGLPPLPPSSCQADAQHFQQLCLQTPDPSEHLPPSALPYPFFLQYSAFQQVPIPGYQTAFTQAPFQLPTTPSWWDPGLYYPDAFRPACSQGLMKPKANRVLFTAQQVQGLRYRFLQNAHIAKAEREELALSLGLTAEQIKVWFQNQRYKNRRRERESQKSSPTSSESPTVSSDTSIVNISNPSFLNSFSTAHPTQQSPHCFNVLSQYPRP